MDTKSIIDSKVKELQPLYDRMDETARLLYLEDYRMTDYNGKALSNVVNVTLNTPAVFANSIIDDLMGSVWQWIVEGEKTLSETKRDTIRNFVTDNLDQADEQLRRGKQIISLKSWLCSHVVSRSLIGVRWISQLVDGEYVLDCLPVDMRYCPFEVGKDGLSWAANITYRSSAAVKAEYPDIEVKENETEIEVKDFWDSEINEVWIGGNLMRSQKHQFGRPPFVIVLPAVGFMLRDKGYIEHEAEDVLFLNKKLFEELNRSVSIAQTKAMETIKPPYVEKRINAGEKQAEPPPKDNETKIVEVGEGWEPLAKPDINQSYGLARQDIEHAVRQGGVNDVDLGNFTPQDQSAIFLQTQAEIRGKFRRPRLEALEVFYQDLAHLMCEQYSLISESGAKEVRVGGTGRRRAYQSGSIGDPGTYRIDVQMMTRNKSLEVANAALAASLWGKLPDDWILKNIMLVEEPEDVRRQLELQKAKQLDPFIGLFEMACQYADEADKLSGIEADIKKIQSMRLTEMAVNVIRQQKQPQQPPQPQQKGNTNALAALAARGPSGGGQ